jgi:hypothetical protein
MVKIQGSTVIARSVEDVFDFIADERNEPKYNPRMIRADKLTPGPIANGTHWSAAVKSRGQPLSIEIEVTEYIRPSVLGSTTRMSTAEINGALTFEPDAAGTRLCWSWELRPKGIFKLMGPLIAHIGKRQEAATWAGLKRYMESTALPSSDGRREA